MRCIYSCYIVMLSQHIISFEYRRTRERDSRLRRKKSLPTDNVCMYVYECMYIFICMCVLYACMLMYLYSRLFLGVYMYVCMYERITCM